MPERPTDKKQQLPTQEQLAKLIQNLMGFVETQARLLQLEAKNELANTIAITVVMVTIAMMAGIVLLMVSIAMALALGILLGNNPIYGFLAMAGIYGLALLILLQIIPQVKKGVSKVIEVQFKRLGTGSEEDEGNEATPDNKPATIQKQTA